MSNVLVKPNDGILHRVTETGAGSGGSTFGRDSRTIGNNIRRILGQSINVGRSMTMGDMTLYEGPAQSTYGIPYAIDGTATVVEDMVAIDLAAMQDPIRAIFATSVHPHHKVVFKRKYVKGGLAQAVPERAPARTISVAFDQREERLARYAIALEQNTNLYLRPAEAKEDLQLKLSGIQEQLAQTWNSYTYAKAYAHGTPITVALQRGDEISAIQDPSERAIAADQKFVEEFCGVVSKNLFPFKSLAANIAKADLYTPAGHPGEHPAVMLVPPGLVDLARFNNKEELLYQVTGIKTDDGKNTISIPLKKAYDYPDANLKVLVHKPPASYRTGGAAFPQVENNEMRNAVVFSNFYIEKYPGNFATYNEMDCAQCIVTDFKHREWQRLPLISDGTPGGAGPDTALDAFATALTAGSPGINNADDIRNSYLWYLRPQMATNNDSAILSTRPGAETGEMLYSYPSAHASSSQHVSQLVITLVVYYGAAVRNPERLLILNGIKFSGIIGGHGTRVIELDGAGQIPRYDETKHDLLPFVTKTAPWDYEGLFRDRDFQHQAVDVYGIYPSEFFRGGPRMTKKFQRTNDIPVVFYRGTTRLEGGSKPRRSNIGHLSVLDMPQNVPFIKGAAVCGEIANPDQVY